MSKVWVKLLAVAGVFAFVLYWLVVGFGTAPGVKAQSGPQSLASFLSDDSDGEYRQVIRGVPLRFPDDHGAHPEFRQEWWYFTGNLTAAGGEQFGYQLTFFRFAGQPRPGLAPVGWNSGQTWMSHFAMTDIGGSQFEAADTFARGGLGLAGAESAPFAVWVNGWSARGAEQACEQCFAVTLDAQHDNIGLQLELSTGAPPFLHGDNGFSAKNEDGSVASYYYSLADLKTTGTLRVGDQTTDVSGVSWMDREWSSALLAKTQSGWDWFALHLDDGRKLMLFQVRDDAGDSFHYGVLFDPDDPGKHRSLSSVSLEPVDTWLSPYTDGRYPISWEIGAQDLNLRIETIQVDQELNLLFAYYEGAVAVQGKIDGRPITGTGYMELTGYAD